MAQGLLTAAFNDSAISVESAGVAAMPGQSANPNTVAVLNGRNTALESFQSRQVNEQMVDEADLIIAMGASHMNVVKRLLPDIEIRVNLLTDFIDPVEGLVDADVPDPFGMDLAAYEQVAEVIEMAIPGIIKSLTE